MSGGASSSRSLRNSRALGFRLRGAFLGMKPLCFFCFAGMGGDEEDVENC